MPLGSASSARRRPELRLPEVEPALHVRHLPRVSVALCVYNGERWLPAQLDSLLAQRDVALEIIIVDDCSTDRSR